MDNKEFGKELESRTRKFALLVIKLSASLPFTPEAKVLRNQITKSGTSIGANYREANRSRSKADFSNKIKICESETNETTYWIELILDTGWSDRESTENLLSEANELLAIFTSISKNLRS
jgi:four helix bundle protein